MRAAACLRAASPPPLQRPPPLRLHPLQRLPPLRAAARSHRQAPRLLQPLACRPGRAGRVVRVARASHGALCRALRGPCQTPRFLGARGASSSRALHGALPGRRRMERQRECQRAHFARREGASARAPVHPGHLARAVPCAHRPAFCSSPTSGSNSDSDSDSGPVRAVPARGPRARFVAPAPPRWCGFEPSRPEGRNGPRRASGRQADTASPGGLGRLPGPPARPGRWGHCGGGPPTSPGLPRAAAGRPGPADRADPLPSPPPTPPNNRPPPLTTSQRGPLSAARGPELRFPAAAAAARVGQG